MNRRTFLIRGLAAGMVGACGGFGLFPDRVLAELPKDLKVTEFKVIPVWNGSMTYVFVKLYT
ncbi:MAG: hypothetical protein KDA52_03900, partial [Planctomycetaceae bacterium]|nr:hypothetical protein [Planctomycetaceae bacterium]